MRALPEAQTAFQAGQAAEQDNAFDEAEKHFLEAILLDSNVSEYHLRLGVVYAKTSRHPQAVEQFQKVIALDPELLQGYRSLALALYESRNLKAAAEACRKGIEKFPEELLFYNFFSKILWEQRKLPEAKKMLLKAVELEPGDSTIRCNLGIMLFDLGEKENAQEQFKQAIKLDEKNTEAHRMLTLTRKYEEDEQLEQLQRLARVPIEDPDQKANVHYALGKIYEDTKDYEQVFSHLKSANDLMKKIRKYDLQSDRLFFDQIKQAYSPEFIDKRKGSGAQDNTPIFILGMPRSGTSLVEQILASHSKIYGGGELDYVLEMQRHIDIHRDSYASQIHLLSHEDFSQLGERYLKNIKERDKSHELITDKMPLNFRFVGLIKLILPSAKIIHCVRNPIDTCLSLYKIKFQDTDLAFSHDPDDLAAYYRLYANLMKYWHELFPDQIYDVVYENIVVNQKDETRKLLEHCGLEWEESCLAFHETERTVVTASSMQVRQPVYKSSVNAWKHYEEFLPESLLSLGA